MMATPVANSPRTSRNAFGSGVDTLTGRRRKGLVATLADEGARAFRPFQDLRFVAGDEGAGHAHRIAEEKALIQNLTRRERRQRGIPSKSKQWDAIKGLGARRLVVVFDLLDQRAFEVRFERHRNQA